MGKKSRIVQPGDGQTVQLGLFSAVNTGDMKFIEDYPPVFRNEEGFRRVLAGVKDMLGIDFEFNPKTLKPTVIGISNDEECCATWYTPELLRLVEEERKRRGFVYSGHAVLSADRQVLEKQMGYETPLEAWSDSMLTFWLANSDLCKNPGKETDEEGGLGFMGLGTMVSLTTDLPHHKTHRGRNCEELICPRCLRGESRVFMADGTKRRIADLTTNKVKGEVLAFDGTKLVPAKITNWFKNPRNGRKFVRVTFDGARHSGSRETKAGVVVTEDHKVLTNAGWVEAGKLQSGVDKIATGEFEYSPETQKFLAGILLGDSHIGKGVLTLVHGAEQKEWLETKMRLFADRSTKIAPRGRNAWTGIVNRSAFGAYIDKEFRANWKNWLSKNFSLESLAVWFLDDGSYHRYQAIISVSSYEEAEIQFLVSLIKTIVPVGDVDYFIRDTDSKNRRTIRFNSEATQWLISHIARFTPSCLRYKLYHPGVKDSLDDFDPLVWEIGQAKMFFSPCAVYPERGRINYRTGAEEDNTVHCIEVAGYHNFLTEGGVVSNCDVRGYCAIDAYGGLKGDQKSREDLKRFGIPESSIVFQHRLTELSQRMSGLGVAVDREYVKALDKSMAEDQSKLFPQEGEDGFVFNPRSAKAIIEWGKANKVYFPSTDKNDVQTVLEKMASEAGFTGERFEEVRAGLDAAAEAGTLDPTLDVVYRLYTYKILGKGTDSWFHPRYFGEDNKLHPRFVSTGTSTGRYSSTTPNIQNVAKRGWGKKIRKAFVPSEKGNVIVEADFSQLELRVILYLAGVDQKIIGADAFSWLVTKSGGLFDKAAQRYGGKPRDIAKSVSHGANYCEGLRLLTPTELEYSRTRAEIEAGALRVYHPKYMPQLEREWTFRGKVVAFTGGNLAQRLFGSKTFENRKKALEIQEDIYFAAFPQIRRFQQAKMEESETRGYVTSPAGRFLRLNDTPEKDAKIIVAFLGQGVGASHVQSVMLEYWARHKQVFFAQIHDALCGEFPLSGGYRAIYNRMKEMEMETPLLPDFTCPCKVEVGVNWGAMEELEEREGELYLGGRLVK